MHHADWAAHRLKEIDDKVAGTEAHLLGGTLTDHTKYREQVARRHALLEARSLLTTALNRDETR